MRDLTFACDRLARLHQDLTAIRERQAAEQETAQAQGAAQEPEPEKAAHHDTNA